MGCCTKVTKAVTRKKIVASDLQSTPLERCLTTADLSFVGIGCMLGSGVYVLTGEVAGEMAGPAATVSFAIAGIVAFLAALCYLECATRIPETGASYLYAYVSMGELLGFTIGWNAVIVRVLSVAFVSRGWSAYFDDAIGGRMSNVTIEVMLRGETWDTPLIAEYPDIIAGVISLFACILVAIGTEISAKANGVFVLLNIITVSLVIVVAFVYADYSNLTGNGGFMPMGFSGVMKGAAACFTGYCGFEAIAFSAEEAKDPAKGLPIAIVVAFIASVFCYIGGVFAITILADWAEINPASPFVSAFEAVDATWMEICVAIGALCSMTGGVINCAFCLARAIYVMGRDGLLPALFAKTSDFSHTPVNATMLGAVLSVFFSVFINFVAIIEFLSLVAFCEFVIVAMACVCLRYSPPRMKKSDENDNDSDMEDSQKIASTEITEQKDRGFEASYDESDENVPLLKSPPIPPKSRDQNQQEDSLHVSESNNAIRRWADKNPTTVVFFCLLSAILNTFVALVILTYKIEEVTGGNGFAIFVLIAAILLALVSCAPLWILRQYPEGIPFKVPLMPITPLVSLLFNIILMVRFEALAWVELTVWTAIGLTVYFAYGMHNSNEGKKEGDSLRITNIKHSAEHVIERKSSTKPKVPTGSLLQPEPPHHPRTQSVAVVVTKDGRTYSTSSYGAVGM